MRKKIVFPLICLLGLSSCAGQIKGVNNEGMGTVLGGIVGGLMGSTIGGGGGRLASVGIATLLGAAIGNRVGHNMDKRDQKFYKKTSHNAFEYIPSGQTIEWSNPDSGSSGSVTPISSHEVSTGSYCRKFKETITVAGNTEEGYGTACRQNDGTWRVTN